MVNERRVVWLSFFSISITIASFFMEMYSMFVKNYVPLQSNHKIMMI